VLSLALALFISFFGVSGVVLVVCVGVGCSVVFLEIFHWLTCCDASLVSFFFSALEVAFPCD
jgi:hypothetical protein